MEAALVAALAEEGVETRARPGAGRDFTGVGAGERKIASIGIHVPRGVTTHGFAVNVQNDLQPFEWVVPCGLAGVRMTSLLRDTRRVACDDVMRCFAKRTAFRFAEAHGLRQRLVSRERLLAVDVERA